jgi:hypothetical protein
MGRERSGGKESVDLLIRILGSILVLVREIIKIKEKETKILRNVSGISGIHFRVFRKLPRIRALRQTTPPLISILK